MTTDTDGRTLIRLMTWLSPSFPVGGFAYSGGLERAVHDGLVTDDQELRQWLETLLAHGPWWNDAVLLAEAWRSFADPAKLADTQALAEALAGSAERHAEVTLQGEAFAEAARAWQHPVIEALGPRPAYCVAAGAVAAAHGVALDHILVAFLQALASQAVSAAIRLGVIGQRQAVDLLAAMEEHILKTARIASAATLDDLGGAAFMADLASMRHETQHSRLFRS